MVTNSFFCFYVQTASILVWRWLLTFRNYYIFSLLISNWSTIALYTYSITIFSSVYVFTFGGFFNFSNSVFNIRSPSHIFFYLFLLFLYFKDVRWLWLLSDIIIVFVIQFEVKFQFFKALNLLVFSHLYSCMILNIIT